ncbi:hypothetical protein LCGC14_1818280 [marine sediment metagenome]|uniref:Uncharacterized protein n=1 Tax=marine sediment metagenome TaxID=412755 RepID=A0A0F9GJQ7_9ZZZZ
MRQKLGTTTEAEKEAPSRSKRAEKSAARWKKPLLEDVSGKVMAQPYIRFT